MSLKEEAEDLRNEICSILVGDIGKYVEKVGVSNQNAGVVLTYLLKRLFFEEGKSKDFCLKQVSEFWDYMEKTRNAQEGGKE
jgi:hypothetical protein